MSEVLFRIEYPKWFKVFYTVALFGYLFTLIIFFTYYIKVRPTLHTIIVLSFLALVFICGVFLLILIGQTVLVTEKGIIRVNFIRKELFIPWNEIKSVTKFPLHIRTTNGRKIKSANEKSIVIEKSMVNFDKFMTLLEEKNPKLKNIVD